MKMHPRFHSSPKYSQGSSGSYAADRSYIDDGKHNVSEEPLQISDLESETILKQRKELQLLIGELKDRDKELNEMVAAHQQQLSAWERDRRRVVELEHRNERLEVEIRKRNEQLRLLIQRLKISDSRQKTKDSIIDTTKQKLVEAQHEIQSTSAEKRDLENMNDALNTSLSDISSKIGRLEAKEQEFFTQLQLKDGDLVEAESEIREMKSKLRRVEVELHECRKNAAAAHVDLEQQKARYKQSRTELDRTIAEMATKTGDLISTRQELTMLREEVQNLKRDLYASEEQIRRKEEFIELQKSKQERTNVELAALRQLYERQQQELSVLQSNLETSQEMLSKQEDRLNDLSHHALDLDAVECSSQTTNDLLEEAQRSSEVDPLSMFNQHERSPRPQVNGMASSGSSPTSKLQRLLSESREMVHNLERTALSPSPRSSYRSRSTERRY
ncbi:uncharacterized protein LOC100183507 [Ciona intestinalis]